MNYPITGRCACGSIRYECREAQKFSLICQCRQCQRISGAGHSVQFAMSAETSTISGDLSQYEMESDSGNTVTSFFCGVCGNPVYKTSSGMPDTLVFHAATLDDPSQYRADMVVHSDSAQPWDCVDPEIVRKG